MDCLYITYIQDVLEANYHIIGTTSLHFKRLLSIGAHVLLALYGMTNVAWLFKLKVRYAKVYHYWLGHLSDLISEYYTYSETCFICSYIWDTKPMIYVVHTIHTYISEMQENRKISKHISRYFLFLFLFAPLIFYDENRSLRNTIRKCWSRSQKHPSFQLLACLTWPLRLSLCLFLVLVLCLLLFFFFFLKRK